MNPESTDNLAAGSQVLSQPEIERLLASVAAGEQTQATVQKTDGTREKCAEDSVQPYDFRAPSFLAAAQWRHFRREQEDFVETLAGRLSNYLRMELSLRLANLSTRSSQDFIQSLQEPTHLVLFKMEPLLGMCLLDVAPRLGLCMVDRLMGGAGQASATGRSLSEIEVALLEQVLQVVLSEWCQRWAKLQDLRPVLLGHETSARYVNAGSPDALLLVLVLEAQVGDCVEEIKFAFPCSTIEPMIRKMRAEVETTAKPPASSLPKPKWNPGFNKVAVPVDLQWPERVVTAREVASLKVGDVLEWEPTATSQARLRLAQAPKFQGRVGTRNGCWALEITGFIQSQNT